MKRRRVPADKGARSGPPPGAIGREEVNAPSSVARSAQETHAKQRRKLAEREAQARVSASGWGKKGQAQFLPVDDAREGDETLVKRSKDDPWSLFGSSGGG